MKIFTHVKAKLAIGIATIIPAFILFHIFLFLYGIISKFIGLEWITGLNVLFNMEPAQIVRYLFAILLTVGTGFGALLLLGYIASNNTGKKLLNWFWQKIASLPVAGRFLFPVRESVKRAYSDYLNAEDVFESIVFLKSEGHREIGFLTGKTHVINGEETYSVFIPAAPVPTAGKLVFVSRDQIELIDMETTEAFNTLLTLGVAKIQTTSLDAQK